MSLWGQTTSDKAPCTDKDDRLIIEEPSGGVKPYCVSASSKTLTSKSNQLTVRFITNGLGDDQGFRAFYIAGINSAYFVPCVVSGTAELSRRVGALCTVL